jgi:hypothetical protein
VRFDFREQLIEIAEFLPDLLPSPVECGGDRTEGFVEFVGLDSRQHRRELTPY